jgi:hypothetical protein
MIDIEYVLYIFILCDLLFGMEDLSNILLRDYLTIQMTMLKAIRLHVTLKKEKRSTKAKAQFYGKSPVL